MHQMRILTINISSLMLEDQKPSRNTLQKTCFNSTKYVNKKAEYTLGTFTTRE